jgi:hypothetical protein
LDEFHSSNMYPFTYQYKGETFESFYALSLEKGDVRYKVKLQDTWFSIVAIVFPVENNRIIWHQANKEDELILSHDLVQAIGEGIEALG